MSDYDRNLASVRDVSVGREMAIDVGLRAHMIRVYNYMAAGVALTGVVAWIAFQMAVTTNAAGGLVPTAFGQMLFSTPVMIGLLLGTLGLVFFVSWRIDKLQPATALALFMLYAGLLGLALAPIFVVYTGGSIARVFFISAATFGALSLWGYTTQRDLTGMGSFLMMGLFGLIIASLVNIFMKSSALEWAISVIGVLVFAGLTAYDTQKIKEMYDPQADGTVTSRQAVMGALNLYLDFINLFLMLLRLVGDRR